MATYIKFNGNDTLYPAVIGGKMSDKDWGGRASKSIHAEMSYDEAITLFADEVEWSIVMDVEHEIERINKETGEAVREIVKEQEIYDNSEYCILGDIIVHKDGTVTVKMGNPTADEILAILLGEA